MSLKKVTLIALVVIMIAGMFTISACKKKAEEPAADTTMVEQPVADTAAVVADTAAQTPAPATEEAKPADAKKTK